MKVEDFLALFNPVEQQRRGMPDWKVRCPSHADPRPSLHVTLGDDGRILLHCFAGCATEDIVGAMGLTMGDLFTGTGMPPRQRTAPPTTYAEPASVPSGIRGMSEDWLMNRGIDPDLAEQRGVAGDDGNVYFVFFDKGTAINVKTRSLKDKHRMTLVPGARVTFFGINHATAGEPLVICEGEIDLLSIAMAGYSSVISVPNGAAGDPGRYLPDADALIEAAPYVIVAVDADEPGQKLEAELIRRIGPEACRRVRWPDGSNDANDVHLAFGLGALKLCLDHADPMPIDGISSPDDFESEYEDLYLHGLQRGLSTGWETVDRYFTVVPGYVTLVTGVPGSGKTEWIDNLMIHMAIEHDWKFGVFSPESLPHAEHLSRWAEKFLDLPFFDGPSQRMSWDEATMAKRWANDHLRFLDPDPASLDSILSLAKIELRRFGINALVIDPWNEVDDPEAATLRDDKYLSKALRTLRRFAEQHVVHIFVVIHPHAMKKNQDTGQYDPVDMYDLHGGSMWSDKASAIISIWRDAQAMDQPVKVYLKKVKTRRIGRRGRVNLMYDRISGRYRETGEFEDGG